MIQDLKTEIGSKIRNLRNAAELTQDELAQRAGLTDGFISQVERGITSISVDSLKMIIDALNITFADFFKEERTKSVVYGEKDKTEIEEGGTGKLVLLVPGATNRTLEPAMLYLDGNASTELKSAYQGDVYGYVIKGQIQLQIGSNSYKVKTGESFYFEADAEYRIYNPHKREAEVLWITSPPYF